jgi:hypothetical protein
VHGLGQGSKDFYIKGKNKNKYVAVTVLLYTVFYNIITTSKPIKAVLDEQPLG